MPLSPHQLEELKRAIDDHYEALTTDVGANALRERDDTSKIFSGDVMDVGERASADQIIHMDDAELLRDLDQLSQMHAARTRLATGDFGRCIDCDREIPYERLIVQPAALRCLACQRSFEALAAHDVSPKS